VKDSTAAGPQVWRLARRGHRCGPARGRWHGRRL